MVEAWGKRGGGRIAQLDAEGQNNSDHDSNLGGRKVNPIKPLCTGRKRNRAVKK